MLNVVILLIVNIVIALVGNFLWKNRRVTNWLMKKFLPDFWIKYKMRINQSLTHAQKRYNEEIFNICINKVRILKMNAKYVDGVSG